MGSQIHALIRIDFIPYRVFLLNRQLGILHKFALTPSVEVSSPYDT